MLSVAECRKILGKKIADKYTDEQIEEMRGTLYALADLTINKYLKEINEKQKAGDSPERSAKQSQLAPAKRHSR